MSRFWRYPTDRSFVAPGTPEHRRVITGSKIPAICGLSRWQSQFSCWHEMNGNIEPESAKDQFDVGHAMELALAELWRIKNPDWRLSPTGVQYVTDDHGFPAIATLDRRAAKGQTRKILEFKTARDLSEWGDPDLSGDLPVDYCAQVIGQMVISGITTPAEVVVMGPFFKHRTYIVEYDPIIAAWIIDRCRWFWQSLQDGEPPVLDDTVSTYKCVKELHPDIDGSDISVPTDLIVQIRDLREEIGPLEGKLRGLKSELLDTMGSAKRAVINGEVVARRQAGSKGGVALVVL